MVLESNTAYLRRIIFCVLVALFCVSCDKEDEYVYLENTDFYGEWYATEINGQKVDSGQLSFYFWGNGRCLIEQQGDELWGRWSFSEHDEERFITIKELGTTPNKTESDVSPYKDITMRITWCFKWKNSIRVKFDNSGDELLLVHR